MNFRVLDNFVASESIEYQRLKHMKDLQNSLKSQKFKNSQNSAGPKPSNIRYTQQGGGQCRRKIDPNAQCDLRCL